MSQTGLYFVARKESYLVVSFRGDLNLETLTELERCKDELSNIEGVRGLILHFAGVGEVSFDAVPTLTLIQAGARARGMVLRLSGLNPELEEKLYRRGVLRRSEAMHDIRQAIVTVARLSGPRA